MKGLITRILENGSLAVEYYTRDGGAVVNNQIPLQIDDYDKVVAHGLIGKEMDFEFIGSKGGIYEAKILYYPKPIRYFEYEVRYLFTDFLNTFGGQVTVTHLKNHIDKWFDEHKKK